MSVAAVWEVSLVGVAGSDLSREEFSVLWLSELWVRWLEPEQLFCITRPEPQTSGEQPCCRGSLK